MRKTQKQYQCSKCESKLIEEFIFRNTFGIRCRKCGHEKLSTDLKKDVVDLPTKNPGKPKQKRV